MCEDDAKVLVPYVGLTRRRFTALAAAAGVTGAAGASFAQAAIAESDVAITTPDGVCDAALFHPAGPEARPGVLLWPDARGLREATRDMGRRLAAQGYAALIVNPYYRSGDAAAVAAPGADRQGMRELITPTAMDRDAAALVAWLDASPHTSAAKMGVQGYCMGGPPSFRTAAVNPDRIGAVATFHGGNLVTDDASSPHLLVGRADARFLVCIAKGDDARDPEVKGILKQAFANTGTAATVEVYGGDHGWCVPDNGAYLQSEAERAWAALGELYKSALT